jgi:ribonuclease VapC
MIVVDSSALMAITQGEERAADCIECLKHSAALMISAVTLAEVLIVAQSRGIGAQLQTLMDGLDFEVVPANETSADQVAFTYKKWGKGNHPARLNLVDCFSYALAKENNCPLLFVGNDFSQTDIESAL